MIALPSFLAALDKLQAKPASVEGDAREATENAPNDGFAALIAQLIQITPPTNEPKAAPDQPAEGDAGNLPTGKILPVDGPKLAAVPAIQIEGEALVSVSPPSPPAVPTNSSATIISFQQAQVAAQAVKQAAPVAP
ncbi:MAG: hypothetical protein KKE77_09920, partial [Alphaproteobacteria bacterium]|nr:hypothetical protein [Alphaproteobacteria bacterium]